MKIALSIAMLFCLLVLSGCSILASEPPTPTATTLPTDTPSPTTTTTPTSSPTATFTPTATETATLTPTFLPTATSTLTKTASPTPACLAANGTWESEETVSSFGMSTPILTFSVLSCRITTWEIWTYPAPGELLWWTGSSSISITDDQFTYDEDTGDGIFTLEGLFDSATTSHGMLFFPKGFSIFGTILTEDVTINWTATPSE